VIVCHCKALTDRDLRAHCARGVQTLEAMAVCCGAGGECGGCRPHVQMLIQAERTARLEGAVSRPIARTA
jgi:bacterioferritin-associated ferredoxin